MSTHSDLASADPPPSADGLLDDADWNRMLKRLNRRGGGIGLVSAKSGKTHPLAWSAPAADRQRIQPSLERLDDLCRGTPPAAAGLAEEVTRWLRTADSREADAVFAYECLAWCYAAPRLAILAPADDVRRLIERLALLADQAQRPGLDRPLEHQLLAGELAWALSVTFPEIPSCKALRTAARNSLSLGLLEVHDGEGLPQVAFLSQWRALLACWTRCLLLARQANKSCFSKDARNQYEWAVTQAIRLARWDGSQVLSDEEGGSACFRSPR